MKKRILALVMAGVMALSLAACGGNSDPKSSNSGTADSDFKVGAIYINKKTDTAGYTYAHHKGITTAMDELGLRCDASTFTGYLEFVEDCRGLRMMLMEAGLPHPTMGDVHEFLMHVYAESRRHGSCAVR